MNNKTLFLTDLILIPLFVLTLYTGLELHVTKCDVHHSLWHDWAVFHSIVSVLFAIAIGMHIHAHKRWYKNVKSKGFKHKNKIISGLLNAFVIVVLTGLLLLAYVNGSNSAIGHIHYILGVVTSILMILHVFKRWKILCKGVKRVFMEKADSFG